jgi:hypothetical protein
MMAFSSMTLCMKVLWNVYGLLEQGAALDTLL